MTTPATTTPATTTPAATGPITVTGGADGIAARTSDIDALRGLVGDALGSLDDVSGTLGSFGLFAALAAGAAVEPGGTGAIARRLAELRDGPLAATRTELGQVQLRLWFAAAGYEHTESGLLGAIGGLADHVGDAMWDAATGNLGDAADQLFRAAPDAVDLVMRGLSEFEAAYAALVPDGHPVLQDRGTDARPEFADPPRTLDALLSELTLRSQGNPGAISVSLVTDADGRRCAIVDIPGTKSWDPAPNPDVTSVGTDIRALTGQATSYEDGVLAALHAAGVGPDTDVMLVGHSEGGIVAVNAARHALASGQFHVTNVITVGSPVGQLLDDLPDSVQVLALENSADIVPAFDDAANPDRPNITTVTVDNEHDDIGLNHNLAATYLGEAELAEHSGNASVDAFLGSADEYLSGTRMTTHAYVITRGP